MTYCFLSYPIPKLILTVMNVSLRKQAAHLFYAENITGQNAISASVAVSFVSHLCDSYKICIVVFLQLE